MRLSTAFEVGGFAVLSIAAFQWCQIAGLCAVGVSLLLVGVATDDDQAIVAFGRLIHPIVRRNAERQVRRTARREARIGSKA